MSITTGMPGRVADNKVIKFEIVGELMFTITAEISWRGKVTFQASVANMSDGSVYATECSRYGTAKRAYKQYKNGYRH